MKLQMLTLTMVFLAACGGGDTQKADAKPSAEKPAAAAEKPAPKPAPAPEPEPEKKVEIVVDDGTVVTVNLEANDAMQFNTAEIKVAAGRTIKLNLKHVGKMPLKMMGHNFVLLAQGTDVAAFTTAGVTAPDTDYIAATDAEKVIAKTKLLGGGEADSIEFTAPAPGTYDFLCTFPGHSAIMKGKLIVT